MWTSCSSVHHNGPETLSRLTWLARLQPTPHSLFQAHHWQHVLGLAAVKAAMFLFLQFSQSQFVQLKITLSLIVCIFLLEIQSSLQWTLPTRSFWCPCCGAISVVHRSWSWLQSSRGNDWTPASHVQSMTPAHYSLSHMPPICKMFSETTSLIHSLSPPSRAVLVLFLSQATSLFLLRKPMAWATAELFLKQCQTQGAF